MRAAPDLVVAIAAADPHAQRTFARWCARRAFEYSTLAGIEWVDPALEDLRAGRVPGAPFDDIQRAFSRWQEFVDSGVDAALSAGRVGVTRRSAGPFDHGDSSVPYKAIPAFFASLDADPFLAAIRSVSYAAHTFGASVDEFFGEALRAVG